MKYVVHPVHGVPYGLDVPDVPNPEFDLGGVFRVFDLELVAHIVLLFLVPGENANLADICLQKPIQYRVAEAPGPAGNHERFVLKHGDSSHYGLFISP